MSMDINSLIEAILSIRKDLSRDDILRMIEEKKREFLGFLSDEGAALILAQELGLTMESTSSGYSETKLSSLVPGLRSVSVKGRIVSVKEPTKFTRSYGREGVVQRVTIMDDDGAIVDIVLWDDSVERFSRLGVGYGSLIRIRSGYTREGLGGRVEVHVGRRSDIEVIERYPSEYEFTPICDLKPDGYFNVKATLCMVYPLKSVRDEGAVRFVRARIADETGWVNLLVWGVKADELLSQNPSIGVVVKVYNGFVKRRLDGSLELHVGRIGRVEVTGERSILPLKYVKVSQLKLGSRVDMLLRLLTYNFRKLSSGRRRVKMLCWDGEDMIRLTIWEEALSYIENSLDMLKPNDVILIQLGRVRERIGMVEVDVDGSGYVYVNPQFVVDPPPPYQFKHVKIGELKEGCIYESIRGVVLTKPSVREVGSDDRKVKVSTIRIGDDTGTIDLTLWRDCVDKVSEIDIGELVEFRWIVVRRSSLDGIEASTTIFSDVLRLGRPTSASS
ncbi:MAG: hypothetical protein QW374_05130 [Candidatus Bathyarchaeia archaeon]|nr:hypothetical protein [Candidatus Bathyarchaeota archaeon]